MHPGVHQPCTDFGQFPFKGEPMDLVGPGTLHVEIYRKYLENVLSESSLDLSKQFLELQMIAKANELKGTLTTTAGQATANRKKNRYQSVLPYDHNRVRLKDDGKTEVCDYVNASSVYHIVPCQTADSNPKLDLQRQEFIAAQGPLPETIGAFWQMIVQHNIRTVVMLTNIYDDSFLMCAQYWPRKLKKTEQYRWGTQVIEVRVIAESKQSASFILRKFLVTTASQRQTSRIVTQFHVTSWPDTGSPDLPLFCELTDTLRNITEHSDETKAVPTLVHCSAGVGRTGTFILASMINSQLKNGVQFLNIAAMLKELRMCRTELVETEEQYKFIHQYTKKLLEDANTVEKHDDRTQ